MKVNRSTAALFFLAAGLMPLALMGTSAHAMDAHTMDEAHAAAAQSPTTEPGNRPADPLNQHEGKPCCCPCPRP